MLNYIKKPSKKTIPLGRKPRNVKHFLKKFIEKDKIENYYPYPIYLSEEDLIKYLKYITKIQKAEEKFGQKKLIKIKKILKLSFKKSEWFSTKVFIFYLTKTQIKKVEKEKEKIDSVIFPSLLKFSNNQLVKTYKEVTKVNSEIYRYLKYKKVDRFHENDKTKTFQPKQLAITDSSFNDNIKILESLNFQEKDLIDFGNEDEKDLIDFDIIIPPKKPTAQELLMHEELIISKRKKV